MELAAQYTVLARWGGAPDDVSRPISWLLIDAQLDFNPTEVAELRLRDEAPAIPSSPLQVADDGSVLTVRTGAATYRIGIEFAFAVEFGEPLSGTTAVPFNTFDPSINPSAAPVYNWLTIVTVDDQYPARFTINRYSQLGVLQDSQVVDIPPFARRDLDGGHGAGPGLVGFNEIIPERDAPYLAQIVRYGPKVDGYSFAVPIAAAAGGTAPRRLTVSNGAGGQNWIEILNPSAQATAAEIVLYDMFATLLTPEPIQLSLASRAGAHFNASAFLGEGVSGAASGVTTRSYSLAPFTGIDLGLHDSGSFRTTPDSYSVVSLTGTGLVADVLRVQEGQVGTLSFVFPTRMH